MDLLAAAATSPATTLLLKINSAIVNPLIILMFAFALVGFVWGVFGYISKADDGEARAKGAQHMLWGIIGMALMVMAFSIIKIMLNTFGLQDSDTKTQIEKVLK